MASMQCQRPVDHTKITTQYTHVMVTTQSKCNTCAYQKPVDHTNYNHQNAPANTKNSCNHTCNCCNRKDNEHSFTNKMKEMATSAYKKVADHMPHHNDHHNNGQGLNPGPKPVSPKPVSHSSGAIAGGKKKDSGMSNCIPKIGDHKRRDKTSKKKGNDFKCKDDSSSSSSDSESDNEGHVKRT